MKRPDYAQIDFDRSPMLVFYEVTQACELACRHCRASAQRCAHPFELKPAESRKLIDQLATFDRPPLLVLTGGDPVLREDLFDLIRHARAQGLDVALTPSATPRVTPEVVAKIKEAGVSRLAVSLDGADAATHEAIRQVPGTYARTMEILAAARAVDLPLQVNTTITTTNFAQVDAMAEFLATQGIVLWSVFLLVPVGRGALEGRIRPQQYEDLFARLWHHAQTKPFAVKTTEAHHYRRYVLQLRGNPMRRGPAEILNRQRAPLGINDGKGVMFVGHTGEIYPSGFLPIRCGRFPEQSVVDVYRNAPLFRQLRDPDALQGKCGSCEFKRVCGGSRARAYAVYDDPMAEEPDCAYLPASLRKESVPC